MKGRVITVVRFTGGYLHCFTYRDPRWWRSGRVMSHARETSPVKGEWTQLQQRGSRDSAHSPGSMLLVDMASNQTEIKKVEIVIIAIA